MTPDSFGPSGRAPDEKDSRMRPAQSEAAPSAEPRYVVRKASGSEWAWVVDTQDGARVKRYSVMPLRYSTRDGWEDAKRHAARLNAALKEQK